MRARIRTWLLVAIGALYLFSVPWYRDSSSPVSFVWGLPDWVAVALACYTAVAVLNSLAWLLADLPEESGTGPGHAPDSPQPSERETP